MSEIDELRQQVEQLRKLVQELKTRLDYPWLDGLKFNIQGTNGLTGLPYVGTRTWNTTYVNYEWHKYPGGLYPTPDED